MDVRLEAVVIPVADVDRAKAFYLSLGWREDIDLVIDDFRIIQFTPPGSGCSIQFGTGLTTAAPGSLQALLLVVDDIEKAAAELAERGIQASGVYHPVGRIPRARFDYADASLRAAGPAPDHASYGSYISFNDPDGNGWVIQEITTRLPGR